MAWLLVVSGLITVAAVAFAVSVTIVMFRRRRRRRSTMLLPAPPAADPVKPDEINEAADCVQIWLDGEWDRKFGRKRRGLSDSSGSVES